MISVVVANNSLAGALLHLHETVRIVEGRSALGLPDDRYRRAGRRIQITGECTNNDCMTVALRERKRGPVGNVSDLDSVPSTYLFDDVICIW